MSLAHHFDYPAEKARQGQIILHKPWQKAVFFTGLAVPILVLLLLIFFPGAGY